MARSVTDAAYLLQAIVGTGMDPKDNYTSAIPDVPDYVTALKYTGLRGARLGVPANILSTLNASDPTWAPILSDFYAAVDLMEAACAIIITTNITYLGGYDSGGNETVVLGSDFTVDLANYFSELSYNPNNIHTLKDLVNFTESLPLEDYVRKTRDDASVLVLTSPFLLARSKCC